MTSCRSATRPATSMLRAKPASALWGYANPDALAHLKPDFAFASPQAVTAYLISTKVDR
jgi:hypothetical protein